MSVAGALAKKKAQALRRQVADVVPVVGLLAETTEAGRLTAADCESLRALAALPAVDRAVLMASVDLFTTRECEIPAEQRERLLRLLDLYGIQFAVASLAADFFFQAEDGIRDVAVTGVQTCALPI